MHITLQSKLCTTSSYPKNCMKVYIYGSEHGQVAILLRLLTYFHVHFCLFSFRVWGRAGSETLNMHPAVTIAIQINLLLMYLT